VNPLPTIARPGLLGISAFPGFNINSRDIPSELAKRRAEKRLYSEFGIEKPKNSLNTQAIGEQLRRLVSREKPHYEL
jgi:hypothetical protein